MVLSNMDLSNIDWSEYLNQATQHGTAISQAWNAVMHSCDELTHWMMNDGSSVTAFLFFVAVCSTVIAYAAHDQSKQLTEQRSDYSRERFVEEMTEAGYDTEVLETIYQYIVDVHHIDFPIMPSDDLYTVLGITDDGIRRATPILLQAMNRQAAELGRLMKPLTTVEDMVKFVSAAPRTTEYVWELQHAQA